MIDVSKELFVNAFCSLSSNAFLTEGREKKTKIFVKRQKCYNSDDKPAKRIGKIYNLTAFS